MSHVLIIFQTDTEHTEQLALAVGVGAVEAEANIRLRRLTAPGAVEVAHKGYGKLQSADLIWADTVVVGLESLTPRPEELDTLLSLLAEAGPGKLNDQKAWTFSQNGFPASKSDSQNLVESALQVAGMVLLPMESLSAGTGDDLVGRMKASGRLSIS